MAPSKNASKHLLWIIPLLLLLGVGGYIFYRYKTFKKPVIVSVDTDAVMAGKSQIANLNSRLFIYNPNNMEIHIDSFWVDMYIDGQLYSKGKQAKPFTIKANDTSKIELPFTFDVGKFKREFETTQKDSGLHKFVGEVFVDIWKFQSVKIPFTHEKNSPVFKAPKPEIKEVKLVKLGLKETILEVTVLLKNPNDVKISTENIFYTFNIEDETIAKGAITKDKFLPKEGATTVTIPITLDLKEAFNEIGLFKKKYEGKSYSLNIHTEIKTPSPDMPNIDFDMAKTGTVEELVQGFKEKAEQKKEEKKEMTREERKEMRKEKREKIKEILN